MSFIPFTEIAVIFACLDHQDSSYLSFCFYFLIEAVMQCIITKGK